VREGRSGGWLCYGYDVVREFDEAAEALRNVIDEICLVPENGRLEIELAGPSRTQRCQELEDFPTWPGTAPGTDPPRL
jgi:hypothetical protein